MMFLSKVFRNENKNQGVDTVKVLAMRVNVH